MQSPVLIFDHIHKAVIVLEPGAAQDNKMRELIAAQRGQVTGSGGSPAR